MVFKNSRRGLATIVTSAIMMSAVCVIGSAGLVWSQSSLTEQQMEMTETVESYTNKLNESLNFEYVYCNDNPCENIIVVITNIGNVGVNISEISVYDKSAGFHKNHPVNNGGIMPDESIAITINDPTFSSHQLLEISATTYRGNILQTQITT